ncbi:MAG: sialidase family protein [Clostridia bacterium]|nr:sialidase family protein [Clostridia bacterium]
MAIQYFSVSKDDSIYEAFPDVVLTDGGKLICVFEECTHHSDRSYARIVKCESTDRGRTWTPKEYVTDNIEEDDIFWNCARISKLNDGRLVILADMVTKKNEQLAEDYYWIGDAEGTVWEGPYKTPCDGIVPDQMIQLRSGRWLLSTHLKHDGFLRQSVWYSDDEGKTWSDRIIVAYKKGLNLCEGSILELSDGTLVCFMRENSGLGLDCYKAISKDGGETWEGPYESNMPGCHRPVAGFLKSGMIMITHRFMHGGNGWVGFWTQNFFAGFTTEESAKFTERKDQAFRIMPIDFDRSPVSDVGYSGWVQFEDGEILVVYYIVDDSPNGQIRAASFYEEDVIIGGFPKG